MLSSKNTFPKSEKIFERIMKPFRPEHIQLALEDIINLLVIAELQYNI